METEKNWLLNPHLDDGPAPWEGRPGDQARLEAIGAEGGVAVRLEQAAGSNGSVLWTQRVTGLPPRRQAALSARVRVAEGEAQLWVRCLDQERRDISGYHQWAARRLAASEEWQETTVHFPVPPDAVELEVGGLLPQQGLAWFRDFSLRLVPDDPEALRAALVEALARQGSLPDAACREAFLRVPRHLFLPNSTVGEAYIDNAILTHCPDAEGRGPTSSSSQPTMMATMLGQLQLKPGLRVLEIGAGTGYNAALLAELVGASNVVSIDLDAGIAAEARAHLDAAGYREICVDTADGWDGYPARAPYDRIILTVGVHEIAPAWVEQLREGGLLLAPFSFGSAQICAAFRKQRDRLVSEKLDYGYFMDLRGRQPRKMSRQHGDRLCVNHDHADESTVALLDGILETPSAPLEIPELLEVGRSPQGFHDFWTFATFSHPLVLQISDPRLAALGIHGSTPALVNAARRQLALMTACFGGLEIGGELQALARRWLDFGRPGLDRLRLIAYPRSGDPVSTLAAGQTNRGPGEPTGMIEKEYTRVVWQYLPDVERPGPT